MSEANAISTSVEYPSGDGPIDARLARPAGEGRWPAVIMLTDIFGVRPVYERMAERLAGQGYAVLLPNLYHRVGRAPLFETRPDFNVPEVRAHMFGLKDSLTRDRIRSDGAAALDFLAAHAAVAPGPVGAVGYCMSGTFALWLAADFPERVGAASSFHGGDLAIDSPDSPHRLLSAIRAELHVGHADQDPMMTPEMIAAFDAAVAGSGVRCQSVLYAGARHGYAIADGPVYDEAAAERHWAAMADLFGRNLKAAEGRAAMQK